MERSKDLGSILASLVPISILILLCGTAAMVSADDSMPGKPSSFFGYATINGELVNPGAEVNAYIDGKLRGDCEVVGTDGIYSVSVNEGSVDLITFTVGGVPASETATWHSGERVRLDLSANDTEVPVVSTPSANPVSVVANGFQLSRLNVTATDNGDIYRVTVNLSTVGGPDAKRMYCIGGDTYSATTTVANGIPNGTYYLRVTAIDFGGNYDESAVDVTLTVGDITDDWRNKWMSDGIVTTAELEEAVGYWRTDTPLEEYEDYVLTTADIQELVAAWLPGAGA